MGEFEKDQNEDKFGQTEKGDKSAFEQLGDDKGEGGQRDIKTDSISTAQADPQELAGAQAGGDFGKQQGGDQFGQDKQQEQGKQFGQDKQQGEDDRGDKFQQGGEDSQR